MATISVRVLTSRQMKGWFFGTPGGAPAPLQPTVRASTPDAAKIGTAARVRPRTSLCAAPGFMLSTASSVIPACLMSILGMQGH